MAMSDFLSARGQRWAQLYARRGYHRDLQNLLVGKQTWIIFDVGANIGQTSLYFCSSFPDCTVFAFEPVLETFQTLAASFNGNPHVNCFNIALGSKEDRAMLYHQNYSGLNSLCPGINMPCQGIGTHELVNVTTLDRFAAMHELDRIDLLKTDTENFDLEVVKGGCGLLEEGRISFIYSEVGFDQNDRRHTYFEDLESYLDYHGYRLVGFYEHYHHPRTGNFEFCNALFSNVKVRQSAIIELPASDFWFDFHRLNHRSLTQ